MNSESRISDLSARRTAETTFDRNVVVVAGAGTGKTTLLVNRLIHLLMKEPRPVAITQIVALTYTNKAATEMKARLRERLTGLTRAPTKHASEGGVVTMWHIGWIISDASRQCKPADAFSTRLSTPLSPALLLVFPHDCVAGCEKKATEY